MAELLLEKLYSMGLIPSTKGLSQCEKVSVSCLCRRRLPIVMVRMKMAETVREAVTFVEQGRTSHPQQLTPLKDVRVGPKTITDTAFLVTRNMEDFVTWVDSSKIRRKIAKYNDRLDDFDLL